MQQKCVAHILFSSLFSSIVSIGIGTAAVASPAESLQTQTDGQGDWVSEAAAVSLIAQGLPVETQREVDVPSPADSLPTTLPEPTV